MEEYKDYKQKILFNKWNKENKGTDSKILWKDLNSTILQER